MIDMNSLVKAFPKKNTDYRFAGLNFRKHSNQYYTMNRVSEDKNKIVVKVADNQVFMTKYGYALILDRTHVVFLQFWQVNCNWFGTEVLLNRQYFNVKEFGMHEDFSEDSNNCNFETWLETAEEQEKVENLVKWSK